MKTIILLCSAILLTACQTTKLVPVYTFPDAPSALMVPGKALKQIPKPVPQVSSNASDS